VKTFKNRRPADKRSFFVEVEFYTNFKHPRLLKLYHSEWNGKFVDDKNKKKNLGYLVFDYCEKGELLDYIFNNPFDKYTCRYYMSQLISVLHFLHSNGVSHRDIKPENICLDKNFDLKLIDPGLCGWTEEMHQIKTDQ
jgi:serine/threonine protein kinase